MHRSISGRKVCPPTIAREPYSAVQAIAGVDAANVDRALIHPVLWDPDSNELADEAVWAFPDRFAIMGWFYLDQPENRALVEHWKERSGMLGLRFYFNERHKQSWVTDGTLDWLWPAAERAGVPVSLAAAMFLPTVGKLPGRDGGVRQCAPLGALAGGARFHGQADGPKSGQSLSRGGAQE
jgi:predicted TIM-barrel fold metal-dependent hydrolase